MTVNNILFIGLSSVGDAIMTTPVMQSLHNHFPAAIFDFVTDRRSTALYETCPYKGNVFLKDKDKFFRGVPDLYLKLCKKRYDVIVDLRTDGLAYLLRGKRKFTKWFAKPYGEHAVEELIGVISSLHGNEPIPNTKIWLTDKHIDYANKQLSIFDNRDKLLAMSVGDPNKPFKTWTTDRFIELLQIYKNDFSGIIYLGGQSEEENTIKVASKVDIPYINVAGNSLLEAAALIQQAFLYLGPDSGLGHIAAAVDTPTISLFSQVGPERFRPWGVKSHCVRGRDDDARNIPLEEISNAIKEFINE